MAPSTGKASRAWVCAHSLPLLCTMRVCPWYGGSASYDMKGVLYTVWGVLSFKRYRVCPFICRSALTRAHTHSISLCIAFSLCVYHVRS
jgi:hypothetical protein